jgi:hypothetical protein
MLFANCVVSSTFQIKQFALFEDFIRNTPSCFPFGLSETKNAIGLVTLNNKKRHYGNKNIFCVGSKDSPCIARFSSVYFLSDGETSFRKIFFEPIHKIFTGINNAKAMGIISFFSTSFIRRLFFYTYCSFSIYNSSKISELFVCPHNNPFIYSIQRTINNIKSHSERLNPEDAKAYAIV